MTDANPDANRPTFSAVIPAFNREKTLGRAIDSALSQTWAPREVIVVDDGSEDGTAGVVASYGERVRYLHQTNAGAPAARNHGAREATGTWLALLDSDDFWKPNHLARIGEAIVATEGAATLYFSDLRRPDGASQWKRAGFRIDGRFALTDDATDWIVRPHAPMMLQCSVIHRARFLASGGLWEALPMRDDTHLLMKLCIAGKACAVAHVGTQMTPDDDSGNRLTTAMGNATRPYWEYSTLLWTDLLARFPELPPRHRGDLERRLAKAHTRLARFDLAEGRPFGFARNLFRAALTDFGTLARTAGRVFSPSRPRHRLDEVASRARRLRPARSRDDERDGLARSGGRGR